MLNTKQQVARGPYDCPAVTPSAQDAIRPLGSLEHLFWLQDQHRFIHFAVTALISGETSPRDWRRALDRLQKRHPIMTVCIDGEPDSVPSFRQAAAAPIPLRIVEEECDESLFWMELLVANDIMRASRLTNLMKEANELLAIVVASAKTARVGSGVPLPA